MTAKQSTRLLQQEDSYSWNAMHFSVQTKWIMLCQPNYHNQIKLFCPWIYKRDVVWTKMFLQCTIGYQLCIQLYGDSTLPRYFVWTLNLSSEQAYGDIPEEWYRENDHEIPQDDLDDFKDQSRWFNYTFAHVLLQSLLFKYGKKNGKCEEGLSTYRSLAKFVCSWITVGENTIIPLI